MFNRRRSHERSAEQLAISPTESRPLNYIYPEAEDSGERRSRVEARYAVETARGDYNVTELIMGRTVISREPMTMERVNANLMDAAEWVADNSSPHAPRSGKMVVEYPRQKLEDPIDGVVISADSDGLRWYDIKVVNGEVLITGRKDELGRRDRIDLPIGSRVTTNVRARVPAGDYPADSGKEPTFEEQYMDEIRGAIVDYNETHPK